MLQMSDPCCLCLQAYDDQEDSPVRQVQNGHYPDSDHLSLAHKDLSTDCKMTSTGDKTTRQRQSIKGSSVSNGTVHKAEID